MLGPFFLVLTWPQETRVCSSLASCGRSSDPLTRAFKCSLLRCVYAIVVRRSEWPTSSLTNTAQLGRGVGPTSVELKAQIPWLRVFVEGVVIVGELEN